MELGVILGVILAIIRVALFCFIMNTLIKNAIIIDACGWQWKGGDILD